MVAGNGMYMCDEANVAARLSVVTLLSCVCALTIFGNTMVILSFIKDRWVAHYLCLFGLLWLFPNLFSA